MEILYIRYLCHESSTRNGNVYEVGGGWVSQVRWQRSRGVIFDPSNMNIDSIASQIDDIEVRATLTLYRSCSQPFFSSVCVQDFDAEPKAYPRSLQDSLHHVNQF